MHVTPRGPTSRPVTLGIPHYLIVDPRDGTWTYQWEIGRVDGFPAYENRLRLPYGNTVTVATEMGERTIGTGDPPRYGEKDVRHGVSRPKS